MGKVQGPKAFVLCVKALSTFTKISVKAARKGLELSVRSVIGDRVGGQIRSRCKSSACFLLTAK